MQKTFIYFDECGDTKAAPFFLLGLLFVTDRRKYQEKIQKVRDDFHFRNEMKFMKISGLRAVVYDEIINLFFDSPDLKFRCLVVDKKLIDWKKFKNLKYEAYNFFSREILCRSLGQIEQAAIYTDAVVRKKEDQFLKEILALNLEFKHNPIKHVEPIDSKSDDFLQVCDLLLGAVNNELTQNTNPFKKKLRKLALRRSGRETFTGEFEDNKLTIWYWKPEK